MEQSKVITVVTLFLIVAFIPANISAGLVLDAYSRGWYSSDGIHEDWNKNTLTGEIDNYYWNSQPYYAEFRSFFVFD